MVRKTKMPIGASLGKYTGGSRQGALIAGCQGVPVEMDQFSR